MLVLKYFELPEFANQQILKIYEYFTKLIASLRNVLTLFFIKNIEIQNTYEAIS